MTTFALIGPNDTTFVLTKDEIMCSQFLSRLFNKIDVITQIKIDSIPEDILKIIAQFMKLSAHPASENWVVEFIKENLNEICPILQASSFLEITELRDSIVNMISDSIQQKQTIDEMRESFGLTNDFTLEEEANVQAQVSWALNGI